MRALVIVVLALAAGVVAGGLIVSKRQAERHAIRMRQQQAAWAAEKEELETRLTAAEARLAGRSEVRSAVVQAGVSVRLSPQEIVARLQTLRVMPGTGSAVVLRQAVYWIEELGQAGPAAFPAIREFLARYEDLDWDTSSFQGRGARDRVPLDFAIPPSLRFGLFDVLRRAGGSDAAEILSESLARTGRGVEVAYLARVLQEMAADKYRELSLSVARSLLASAVPFNGTSPLDRNHRDYLYGVLSFYGDTSFAREAEGLLVQADSQIDRGALRYLAQSLGAQAVPIVSEAYDNPSLTNATAKEPLARLALSFVGVDTAANEFYRKTINDPLLTRSDRKNLIEDLNQDGFADTRNLTARDLPMIQNRMALIERLAPEAMDAVNAAAFKEAYKDLVNMRDRILNPPAPVPVSSLPGQRGP